MQFPENKGAAGRRERGCGRQGGRHGATGGKIRRMWRGTAAPPSTVESPIQAETKRAADRRERRRLNAKDGLWIFLREIFKTWFLLCFFFLELFELEVDRFQIVRHCF